MNNKSKRLFFIIMAALLILPVCALTVFGASPAAAQTADDDIIGCYEYDMCLYMCPLSSTVYPFGETPYIYGVGKDSLIIANTETGDVQPLSAKYERAPVTVDEFTSKLFIYLGSFQTPDISLYKDCWRRAVFSGGGLSYSLYEMAGDDIWLAELRGDKIWSIYRLRKTDSTTLNDLNRALDAQNDAKGLPQMTLKDVYTLAARGDSLTLRDLDGFDSSMIGSGFTIKRYDVEGGCVLLVHCDSPDSSPNFMRLSKQGYDPFAENLTVDIRGGTDAVAAYLDPLHALSSLKIDDAQGGASGRELIYEFDGYRYYLNSTRADQVFITFETGDRLPLKQALEERRTVIEELVANGLYNVYMEPADNPLGGAFPSLHHRHTFAFDGVTFYPSKTFMYVVDGDRFVTYFDISELADVLWLQGNGGMADKLHRLQSSDSLTTIAGKAYMKDTDLAALGITVSIGWELSSHTPVNFSS